MGDAEYNVLVDLEFGGDLDFGEVARCELSSNAAALDAGLRSATPSSITTLAPSPATTGTSTTTLATSRACVPRRSGPGRHVARQTSTTGCTTNPKRHHRASKAVRSTSDHPRTTPRARPNVSVEPPAGHELRFVGLRRHRPNRDGHWWRRRRRGQLASAATTNAGSVDGPGTEIVKLPLSLNGPMASVTKTKVLNVPLIRTEP